MCQARDVAKAEGRAARSAERSGEQQARRDPGEPRDSRAGKCQGEQQACNNSQRITAANEFVG